VPLSLFVLQFSFCRYSHVMRAACVAAAFRMSRTGITSQFAVINPYVTFLWGIAFERLHRQTPTEVYWTLKLTERHIRVPTPRKHTGKPSHIEAMFVHNGRLIYVTCFCSLVAVMCCDGRCDFLVAPFIMSRSFTLNCAWYRAIARLIRRGADPHFCEVCMLYHVSCCHKKHIYQIGVSYWRQRMPCGFRAQRAESEVCT
jgi:hypothetical protein